MLNALKAFHVSFDVAGEANESIRLPSDERCKLQVFPRIMKMRFGIQKGLYGLTLQSCSGNISLNCEKKC